MQNAKCKVQNAKCKIGNDEVSIATVGAQFRQYGVSGIACDVFVPFAQQIEEKKEQKPIANPAHSCYNIGKNTKGGAFMSFEKYTQTMTEIDECIRPQGSASFSFDGTGCEDATRLFMTGETGISPYWKTEPDYQMLYRRIDDALRSDKAKRDRFCLDYSGTAVPYTKIAYKKVVTPFRTPMFELNNCTDEWSFGVSAWAKDLKVYGFLRVTLEVRYQKSGVDKYSTVAEPDEVFTVDIPTGSYGWTDLYRDIVIDAKNVANVAYILEGENYEGEVYFEAPRFASTNGHNLLGQFLPHSEDTYGVNWMGQNLSHIEWIGMRIALNGETVFDGEIFERCHRFSEAEIRLPAGAVRTGENEITFTCTSNYRDAAGYVLREFGFITEKKSALISVPVCVTVGVPFSVAYEGRAGEEIAFSSEYITPVSPLVLQNDGLNALSFVCNTAKNGVTFTLGGETREIARCVERADDGVITGTGDMIYISITEQAVTDYLKWYLSRGIGNLLTVRPSYRWNGTRIINGEVYRKTAAFLDGMGIAYSHMLDGRELPGANGNPLEEELASPHFLGRQTHEFDGQFVYWGVRDVTENLSQQMFYDLFLRMWKKDGERMNLRYMPENVHYEASKQQIFRSPVLPSDMQTAAERAISYLRDTRKGVSRHTGPATLFKYFYQAGYKWVGAELLYTPTELTASTLRGARDVYGGHIGAHLAIQWSTSPHDTETRYRRYRLGLFVSYLQGIDEINTEEGLWRLEEYYNYHHRFTPACEHHTLEQQDFYRFITSHTRRGRYYTPIAFLNGRYDGWRCFGRGDTWGVDGFGFGDPERAWDLLTAFYPKSVLNSIYIHNCPDEEIGMFSGTPNGNVDIIPIEAEDYSAYRLLVAPGYNKAEEADMAKLGKYVREGGTLLIGWPQLSVTTDRAEVLAGKHTYLDGKERTFTADTYQGHPVSICADAEFDEVLLRTDAGKALVGLKKYGTGRIYFVNAKEYAGARAVDLAYREMLARLTDVCLAEETVYARGSRNVQFNIYENKNGERDIYFIATDWHKENPDGVGTLLLGDAEYEIPVPWGQTVKAVAYKNAAIYPERDENEVVSFDGKTARLQGVGIAAFFLCKNGKVRRFTVDFTENSVQEITLAETEE